MKPLVAFEIRLRGLMIRSLLAGAVGLDLVFVRHWPELQAPAMVSQNGSWRTPWGKPAQLELRPPSAPLGNRMYSGEEWSRIFAVTEKAKKEKTSLSALQSSAAQAAPTATAGPFQGNLKPRPLPGPDFPVQQPPSAPHASAPRALPLTTMPTVSPPSPSCFLLFSCPDRS